MATPPLGGLGASVILDEKLIQKAAYERRENLVLHILDSFLVNVESKKDMIDALLETPGNIKNAERAVRELVSKHIALAVEGKLSVIDYSQKSMAKQTVYLFAGTHWSIIDGQDYYDFVKKAAKKMGLEDLYAEDTDFMNKVFERVAFRVMGNRRFSCPQGEIWINFMNCTLEIHDGGAVVQREHNAEDFFTYVLPYNYNPEAECPLWHKFLDRVLPEDSAQMLLAEYISYCFTDNMKLEKMAVFYGGGCNGKSVALDVIEALMGRSNVSNVSLSDVTIDDEKRAQIENKLVNISTESDGKLDYAVLKQLVSGEKVNVRVLYKGTHSISSYAKFITSFNKLPKSEGTFGFFRRWLLFPFNVTIPEEEQDIDLTKKLCGELSGIFNWVLKALTFLLKNRYFSKSSLCDGALLEYKRQSNSVLLFMDAMCEISDDASIKLSKLYQTYITFCKNEDINNTFGKKSFQEVLKSFGAKPTISHKQTCYNIKIKEESDGD